MTWGRPSLDPREGRMPFYKQVSSFLLVFGDLQCPPDTCLCEEKGSFMIHVFPSYQQDSFVGGMETDLLSNSKALDLLKVTESFINLVVEGFLLPLSGGTNVQPQ